MNDLVRELRIIEEQYKNRVYSTCEIRICDMAKDCADEIERLQSENTRLKAEWDKAVEDINAMCDLMCDMGNEHACEYCKKQNECDGCDEFEWRGLEESE